MNLINWAKTASKFDMLITIMIQYQTQEVSIRRKPNI